MGATSSSTKTRTFQLRNDESLDIPISFDMKFLEMLDQDGKSTTGMAEKRISESSVESSPGKVHYFIHLDLIQNIGDAFVLFPSFLFCVLTCFWCRIYKRD